jgi:hypothetical protein
MIMCEKQEENLFQPQYMSVKREPTEDFLEAPESRQQLTSQ